MGVFLAAPAWAATSASGATDAPAWVTAIGAYGSANVLAAGLAIVAVLTMIMAALRRSEPAYAWLAVALLLSAAACVDFAPFLHAPTTNGPILATVHAAVLPPLVMAAWILACRAWMGGGRASGLMAVLAALCGLYIALAVTTQPWFSLDSSSLPLIDSGIEALRIALVTIFAFYMIVGLARRPSISSVLAFIAAILVVAAAYGAELNQYGVQQTFYPLAASVSRTDLATAGVIVAAAVMLLVRVIADVRARAAAKSPPVIPWGEPPKTVVSDAPRPKPRKRNGAMAAQAMASAAEDPPEEPLDLAPPPASEEAPAANEDFVIAKANAALAALAAASQTPAAPVAASRKAPVRKAPPLPQAAPPATAAAEPAPVKPKAPPRRVAKPLVPEPVVEAAVEEPVAAVAPAAPRRRAPTKPAAS